MNLMGAVAQGRRTQGGMIVAPKSIPAPTGGWVTAQNLAASEPNTCIVLDNMRATTKSVAVRGGNSLYSTLGDYPVESFMNYVGAITSKLFAGAGGNVFDATSVADPLTPPPIAIAGQTSNYYAYVNFATTGGYFLYGVNGTDSALLYDGANFTQITAVSTPAITGATTSSFSHVNVYRNRLYFVERNSLIVHYLPVDSIGGAASQLNLAGIFRKGGSVYFTATWSSVSGSSSLEDYLVVVSTEGELAIFQGSFPGGTDWSLIGTAEGPRPLGINGWMKAGGDIAILTERGWIAVSAIRMKDPAALSIDALSSAIEPDWTREALNRRTIPWEVAKWERKGYAYINCPVVDSTTGPITFVKNLQTGAWSRYTGWDNRCLVIHNEQLYFGSNDGTIRLAEITGYDASMPYTAVMALSWDHLGAPGFTKTVRQAKAEFIAANPFTFLLSASSDYISTFPNAPNVLSDNSPASVWDVGLFDTAVWDAGIVQYRTTSHWRQIGQTGEILSMQLQIPVGDANTPSVELTILHYTSQQGGLTV